MKRPFAVVGITFFCALSFCAFLLQKPLACFITAGVAAFLGAVVLLIKKFTYRFYTSAVALSVCAAALLFGLKVEFIYKPLEPTYGKIYTVDARLLETPYKTASRNGYYYLFKTVSQSNELPSGSKIYVYNKVDLGLETYDIARFSVYLERSGTIDDGLGQKQLAEGIYHTGFISGEAEKLSSHKYNIFNIPNLVRGYIGTHLNKMLGGDTAGVAAGVLTGDTSGISFDLMQDFSATGVSHMFSVSGLHTSIICMFFYQLLCIAKISKRKASIVSIAFVLFFIAVSGFAPSAVRAGIMLIAMFIGGIFGRTSDGLNSLGIAAFIITVIDPFWIFSASLQLSFWATFGILLGGMPLREFLIKYAKKIPIPPMRWFFVANIDFFAVGLCAVVFTLPISMFLFSEVSIVSSITNFMSVFPIMLVLICSILSVLFSVIPIVNFLCYPFALVTGLASNSLISNSVLLAKFSWATAPLKPPFVMLWLAGTLVLLGTAMLIKRSFKVVLLSSAISLAALIAGVVSYSAVTSPLLRVDILNVGDGFYLTVTQKGKSAVIAGKGDYNRMNRVRESLTGLGIKKVDYFFCSEDSAEMENEACAVSRYFDIDTAVMPQAREWYIDSSRQTLLGQNGSISLSKDVQIKYIFTDGYCFWLITYGDFSLLAAPVLSYNTEGLPADFLNADAIVCRSLTKVAGDRFASSNFVVVSSSGERAEAISAMLSEFGFASVTTGGRTVHIVSDGSEGFKVR